MPPAFLPSNAVCSQAQSCRAVLTGCQVSCGEGFTRCNDPCISRRCKAQADEIKRTHLAYRTARYGPRLEQSCEASLPVIRLTTCRNPGRSSLPAVRRSLQPPCEGLAGLHQVLHGLGLRLCRHREVRHSLATAMGVCIRLPVPCLARADVAAMPTLRSHTYPWEARIPVASTTFQAVQPLCHGHGAFFPSVPLFYTGKQGHALIRHTGSRNPPVTVFAEGWPASVLMTSMACFCGGDEPQRGRHMAISSCRTCVVCVSGPVDSLAMRANDLYMLSVCGCHGVQGTFHDGSATAYTPFISHDDNRCADEFTARGAREAYCRHCPSLL